MGCFCSVYCMGYGLSFVVVWVYNIMDFLVSCRELRGFIFLMLCFLMKRLFVFLGIAVASLGLVVLVMIGLFWHMVTSEVFWREHLSDRGIYEVVAEAVVEVVESKQAEVFTDDSRLQVPLEVVPEVVEESFGYEWWQREAFKFSNEWTQWITDDGSKGLVIAFEIGQQKDLAGQALASYLLESWRQLESCQEGQLPFAREGRRYAFYCFAGSDSIRKSSEDELERLSLRYIEEIPDEWVVFDSKVGILSTDDFHRQFGKVKMVFEVVLLLELVVILSLFVSGGLLASWSVAFGVMVKVVGGAFFLLMMVRFVLSEVGSLLWDDLLVRESSDFFVRAIFSVGHEVLRLWWDEYLEGLQMISRLFFLVAVVLLVIFWFLRRRKGGAV